MKYQGHGWKLSQSFKMTKVVVLKAEVSKSVYLQKCCKCAAAAYVLGDMV